MLTTLSSSFLQEVIHLERRYTRSVYLERDLRNPDSILGYVITPKVQDFLQRFADSLHVGATRAWTITGVYGTGKSAAAHFLTALCSESDSELHQRAKRICGKVLDPKQSKAILNRLEQAISPQGLLCAVVTARREAIHHTVLRALLNGLQQWSETGLTDVSKIYKKLSKVMQAVESGQDFDPMHILDWIGLIHEATGTGILLILDELGKSFEFAAQYPQHGDLYLLQKLAEYPSHSPDKGLFVIGLLHQSFSDYSQHASHLQQREWSKIQGRFEDVPFAESTEQVLQLMGHSIAQHKQIQKPLLKWSEKWHKQLQAHTEIVNSIDAHVFAKTYPLHPLSALVLPMLCQRYAQNERSLFTFLASSEPHALPSFLEGQKWDEANPATLNLAQVFDYFIESAYLSASSNTLSQRWIEIQTRLADARDLEPALQVVLKTVAVLNLISLNGTLRARRDIVISALCCQPDNAAEYELWKQKLELLIRKGFVTWWEGFDEVRIWQGSNFDFDSTLRLQLENSRLGHAEVFQKYCKLPPLVAQRHSYQTGTLRYFERNYLWDPDTVAKTLLSPQSEADGFLYYLLLPEMPEHLPTQTEDGRPILYLCSNHVQSLIARGMEFAALNEIAATASQLSIDTVARKELDYRIAVSQRQLDDQLFSIFHAGDSPVLCKNKQGTLPLTGEAQLRQILSEAFDTAYPEGLELWNELLNRQELTSQGAKARRELIQRMLEKVGQPQLGIEGYGPERSMFESLLIRGGLYQQAYEEWRFVAPASDSPIAKVWKALAHDCLQAKDSPLSVATIFNKLQKPPYGVKKGPLPVLLVALLQHYSDELSLFQDGTFIPVLGPEHFELLVKHPHRFAVKSFELEGFKASFFKQLWKTLKGNQELQLKGIHRNETLLAVIKPLVQFSKKLPNYTKETRGLNKDTLAFRSVLLNTADPADMLFQKLPQALGFPGIDTEHELSSEQQQELNNRLVTALSELNQAYPRLLGRCRLHFEQAFASGNTSQPLREVLTRRAAFLQDKTTEPKLVRFFKALLDNTKDESSWMETLVMVIADKPPQQWKDQDFIETRVSELGSAAYRIESGYICQPRR
jgi:hypothetical protein